MKQYIAVALSYIYLSHKVEADRFGWSMTSFYCTMVFFHTVGLGLFTSKSMNHLLVTIPQNTVIILHIHII